MEDEIDCANGIRIEKCRTLVFNGDENWAEGASKDGIYKYSLRLINANSAECLCSHFKSIDYGMYTNYSSEGIYAKNTNTLGILTSSFSTLESFKTWLKSQYEAGTPVTVVYAVAYEKDIVKTPLTEEEMAQYKALTTNKPVTNVFNDAEAHTKVTYVADTKNYIDNNIKEKYNTLQSAVLSLGGVL